MPINVKDASGATVAVATLDELITILQGSGINLTAAQITTLTPPAAITGFATATNQATDLTRIGDVTEAAPGTDIASSGLNGRLQRIAQRLTSLIALLPTALGGAGGLKVEQVAALPAGTNNIGDIDVLSSAQPTPLANIASGEKAGSVSASQFATVTATYVRIKARSNNVNSIYLGGSGVTVPEGTTDTTSGFELAPGEDTGWLPTSNLNKFYLIGTAATDDATYLVVV